MRVYMHYEEEDPNHTAVLTSTGPDTLLDDLLCDFLRSYVEHYGEGAADLDAAVLELRSSKQKKLKRAGKVSEQVQDRDDIFVVRSTVIAVKKSRRKQIVLDLPSAPAAAIHRPSPVAARAASGIEEEDGDDSAQAAEAERMHTMQEEMRAVALEQAQANAKPVGQFNNVTGTDRFAHQFDRKILGNAEEDQIIDASPMPTQEAIVQANCLKCRQHMFYPGQTALVSCHACKLLHMGVECPHCGTFFPAPADAGRMACPVCSGQGDLSTFEAQRRKSFISDDAISSLELAEEPQDIHLIMQYYCDKNPERQREVDECLRKNLANPYIRHVHVLTENPMDMTPFTQGKGDKLVQYVQGNWLTYRDAVDYASRFLRNSIVMLANADIHFDASLARLKTLRMDTRCFALTRHDVGAEGLSFQAGAAPISQDVWIWRSPLPTTLSDIDFQLGKPGCDNRFAYELRAAGLRVLNPASSIIALHLHASDIRNYVHGPDTVQGAYAAVVPVRNIT